MHISLVDKKLKIDTKVSLDREAAGWAEVDIRSKKCRLPANEHFLSVDLHDDGSVEFELMLLTRATYFQYAYRRCMHREQPDLLRSAENVDKANEMLRRYGILLALAGLQPDACPSLQHADPACCQYQAMMELISEGYRAQTQCSSEQP